MFIARRPFFKTAVFSSIFKTTTNINSASFQPRMQSTTASITPNHKDNFTNTPKLSDADIKKWMEAIDSLDAEFSAGPFKPEESLALEGQGRINFLEEATKRDVFEPSHEQVVEWEALKKVPIPAKQDPILEQVMNMIMRHGKKEKARKMLSRALYIVYCETRKDPVVILKKALDDLAPLMITRTFKTRVAKAAMIPVPLSPRQRYRMAWKWITEGSDKRTSSDFSVRLGQELISVYKGNCSGFEKRNSIHKTAIAHRAYIKLK